MHTQVSAQTVSGRVRLGIFVLPISGVVILAGRLISPTPPASSDIRANAEYYASTRLILFDLFLAVSALLSIFGLMALYAYLSNGRAERWAFYAMVFSVPGLASASAIGGQDTALAPIARQYLVGHQAAWDQVWTLLNGLEAFTLIDAYIIFSSFVLFPIGMVLFGVAIWRSQTLPQGAAILLFAFLFLYFGNSLTPWAAQVSDLLFVVASGWIAWAILRQPSAGAAKAEPQARVR